MRRNRTMTRSGLPLCQWCFTPVFPGDAPEEHSLLACGLRVRAELDKALHRFQLWQDRYTALRTRPGAETENVDALLAQKGK